MFCKVLIVFILDATTFVTAQDIDTLIAELEKNEGTSNEQRDASYRVIFVLYPEKTLD